MVKRQRWTPVKVRYRDGGDMMSLSLEAFCVLPKAEADKVYRTICDTMRAETGGLVVELDLTKHQTMNAVGFEYHGKTARGAER